MINAIRNWLRPRTTPFTQRGLEQYDELPVDKALALAWNSPGIMPEHHARMQEQVRRDMPLLGRHLDRLPVVSEEDGG